MTRIEQIAADIVAGVGIFGNVGQIDSGNGDVFGGFKF